MKILTLNNLENEDLNWKFVNFFATQILNHLNFVHRCRFCQLELF